MSILETAFRILNRHVFGSKLEEVQFVPGSHRKETFAFWPPHFVEINPRIFNVTPREMLDELTHVLVHRLNYQLDIVDSNQNGYHSEAFSGAAAGVGLFVAHAGSRGWAITSSCGEDVKLLARYQLADPEANQRLLKAYERVALTPAKFAIFQKHLENVLVKTPRKTTNLRYVCNCKPPHNTIWCGRRPTGTHPLDCICNRCGAKFVLPTC